MSDRAQLAPRRGRGLEVALAAGHAVDHAMQLRAAAHLVDAGVAGEAAPNRLAPGELVDPLRIGDQRAADDDGIAGAPPDRRLGDRRPVDAPHGEHRDADRRADVGGEVEMPAA